MIIVTGGAGFIGSNLVKALNDRGIKEILVVDNLTQGKKFKNLIDCEILDYWDQDNFLKFIENNQEFSKKITAVFHQGACSDTTEWNGRYVMQNNYEYSKTLLNYCESRAIPFIYASSAAIYGGGKIFKEEKQHEAPLNVYGYSKYLFDQYVRSFLPAAKNQIVGLRYFNVYGPREDHKDKMASVAFHFNQQVQEHGVLKLFEGSDGYGPGEQCRDFVFVDDVVAVNLWFLDHPQVKGIFNCGTGRSEPFLAVAHAVIDWHKKGKIEFIPFPEKLKGHYQSFTQADLTHLRNAGCDVKFKTVAEGVRLYLDRM